VLLSVAIVATLLTAIVVVENWRGERAWSGFAAEYAARGEPLDVLPAPSSLPPEINFMKTPVLDRVLFRKSGAAEVRQYFNGIPPLFLGSSEWREGKCFDSSGFLERTLKERKRLKLSELPAATSPAGVVLATLATAEPVLGELRQAVEMRPKSQVVRPVAFTREAPFDVPLVGFQATRNLVSALSIHASAKLAEGRNDEADADALAALRYSRGFTDMTDDTLVEAMIGVVCSRMALQPVWEGCRHQQWTDSQLARLQHELALIRPMAALERSFRTERTIVVLALDTYLPAEILKRRESSQKARHWSPIALMPRGWVQQNKVASVRMVQPAIDAASSIGTPVFLARLAECDRETVRTEERSYSPYSMLAEDLVPTFHKVIKTALSAETDLTLARTACALERHRLAMGAYPESLGALVPSLLAVVPTDPVDGQPLRYRRDADGTFLLYSIGIDGKDDAGRPALWAHQGRNAGSDGDWVWPRLVK
jgi:hypothetical protein